MERVATILRFLQLYSHIAHNMVSGATFFEDHSFLGGLYPAYESEYDDVVERMIGLGMTVDLFKVQHKAVEMLDRVSFSNAKQAFQTILDSEKKLASEIETEAKLKPSQGTLQTLGTIAENSEVRQYKLKQRLA